MHRRHDVLRFEEHRRKHRRQCFFQKHRQNIASLRKKRDVLHDVLGTLFKAMTKAWLFSQKCNPE